MFVCIYDDPECVWVRFPKTGSTSIKHGLFKGQPPHKRLDFIPDEYKAAKSFTVVRNPYSRMASVLSMFRNNKSAKTQEEREHQRTLTVQSILDVLGNSGIRPKPAKQGNYFERLKSHALPMTSVKEVFEVAKIFKFEDFDIMWKNLAFYLDVREPNSAHMKNKFPKIDLDEHDRELVSEYFRKDFEAFGYDL